MRRLDYDAKLFVSSIVGLGPLSPYKEHIEPGTDYSRETIDLIEEIRPKLAVQYRSLSTENLAVAGIFLVARKPERVRNATNTAGNG
jgi:hypothetical protein